MDTVLIIDDDADFRAITTAILEGKYQVIPAASGLEAISLLKNGLDPDCILLDVSMPGMNGYETLQRIFELPVSAGTPIIFLTGSEDAEEAELHGLELGAMDYLRKPIAASILLKRLEIYTRHGKDLKPIYREKQSRKKPVLYEKLTDWELDIARLAQQRFATKEIAVRLSTTPGTIQTALYVIYQKLDIHFRSQLEELDL
ncbi:MAG: response regulator [Spirochaetaceae bacterium]|jgi:DNA-binding NarL/FixJ family response regulator|nr:response regulator [Spirochaetaceae bacterium]